MEYVSLGQKCFNGKKERIFFLHEKKNEVAIIDMKISILFFFIFKK